MNQEHVLTRLSYPAIQPAAIVSLESYELSNQNPHIYRFSALERDVRISNSVGLAVSSRYFPDKRAVQVNKNNQ